MTYVMVCFLGLDDRLANKGEKSQQRGEDLTEQRAINQTSWAEWNLLCYDMWHNNNILWYYMLICVVTCCCYVEVSRMLLCVTHVMLCYDRLCLVMLMICYVMLCYAVLHWCDMSWRIMLVHVMFIYGMLLCYDMIRHDMLICVVLCVVHRHMLCYDMSPCCGNLIWRRASPLIVNTIHKKNCPFVDRWTLDSEFGEVQNKCQYKTLRYFCLHSIGGGSG